MESTLCFLLACCLVCVVLEHWNVAVPAAWRLPISVVIFLAGMVTGVVFLKALKNLGAVHKKVDLFISGMQGASYLDPHAIFYVLLPPLLYESASSMSWHVLRKVLPSALLLALPGVVLNTIGVGVFAKFALHVEDYGEMTWEASLLLASILSATDPVAVVAALHSLGAPKKLATLIEGESLLNDGSAVVFFGVFLDMVATGAPDSTKQCPGLPPAGGCVLLYFIRLALGGAALGALVGSVLFFWINWARAKESPVLEIAIVLTSIYGVFFVAEQLHVSGVLAVVTLGIVVTASVHARMSHEGRHAHHFVLAQISYICNHVIFFSAGMISARFMWTATECVALYKSPMAWLELLLLYVALHVMRALVIALFSPVLTRLGYGITWKEGAILVWGGLRGAVGLALGLLVEHQAYVDDRVSATVAFHVSGIVLLTLIVNGMTIDTLYRRLKIYPPNPFGMTYLRKSLCILEEECGKAILERMLDDWFFSDIDFESILGCVPNFSRIEFSEARVPYPDGIKSVKETLASLEAGATLFKLDLRRRQTRLSPTACWGSMKETMATWDTLKESEHSEFLEHLWEVASSGSGKDHLANVVNTGDQRFEYKVGDGSCSCGLYVSVRPLSQLSTSGSGREFSFNLKLLSMDDAHVVVGLVAKVGGAAAAAAAVSAATDGEMLLGAMENSVGFDCLTGQARHCGAEGAHQLHREENATCVRAGCTVQVTVMREEGGEWQVFFATGDNNVRNVAGCTIGPFPPDQLFPAIQFCPRNQSLHRSKTLSLLLTGDNAVTTTAATKTLGAAVHLSYEPQTASDEESFRQMFRVIFNMVTHHYHDMHHHDLIGNEALASLIEAVESAVDCAEGEVNHVRARDFERLHEMCRRPSSKNRLERLSMQLDRGTTDGSRTYLHLFEPMVVEYLDIEKLCAKQSVFDRLPKSWSLFRRFDYHRMLVKVETLWAFVEAHESVIRNCSALERFPDLTRFLEYVVSEAKLDLKILADIKPRRFWYGKHFLALKVLMTKKHETLERFAQEGWLARDDCAHLSKSLRDRICEVELFIPRVYHAQVLGSTFPRSRLDSLKPVSPSNSEERSTPIGAFRVTVSVPTPQSNADSVVPRPLHSPSSSVPTAPLTQRERLETALGLNRLDETADVWENLPGCAVSPMRTREPNPNKSTRERLPTLQLMRAPTSPRAEATAGMRRCRPQPPPRLTIPDT